MNTMAYDEDLADRIRVAIQDADAVTEKKMFGGLGFMVHGHMAVAAAGQGGLMVRCDPEDTESHLARGGIAPMEMRGREMNGWLLAPSEAIASDEALRHWVDVGVAYVMTLPPK